MRNVYCIPRAHPLFEDLSSVYLADQMVSFLVSFFVSFAQMN